MLEKQQIKFFEENGYLVFENLLSEKEVVYYRDLYEKFLSGEIDVGGNRSDLSGIDSGGLAEKITQIMRPSKIVKSLTRTILYKKVNQIAQELLGKDMKVDFDMLIDKAPYTNVITPWHQDEAYWINMPDKRAVSCWIALDNVKKANGCMWFEPKSHLKNIKKHKQVHKKGALQCEGSELDALAVELMAGSCTFHHGRTLHYSRGNSTDLRRRAFIINLRPKTMITFERERGFDHLGEKKIST